MWYGVSSIAARFLFYLLTPYLTLKLSVDGYGDMSILYAAIPFLNVIFTYGIETAFFRFATKDEYKKDIYSTATISVLCSTFLQCLGKSEDADKVKPGQSKRPFHSLSSLNLTFELVLSSFVIL